MRHVYLHVPFCRRRCSYCDFSIAVRRAIPAPEYVAAIQRERAMQVAAGDWDEEPLETLYLGGGTPSLLPADALRELTALFLPFNSRGRGGGVEVTIEANPDDVTLPAATAWRDAGVNRVSLGVQSFRPQVLSWMHRTHGPDQAARAVESLRQAGLENISLDLIFALPDEVQPDFPRDLDRALALNPDHLSIYGLSVEPRTALARWTSRGAMSPTGEVRYADEFLLAHTRLTAAGYEHYEVSNYARPGRRSRHNSAYWTGAPYAGLGPSAHAYLKGIRRWNLGPWAAYQRTVAQGKSPEEGRETLSQEERRLERVYLGLRTSDGIPTDSVGDAQRPFVEESVRNALLQEDGRRLRATALGWLTLDALVARLTT